MWRLPWYFSLSNLVFAGVWCTQVKTFRRHRFLHSCIRGTIHANSEHLFQTWSHTLYAARWREVISFLRHLVPVLPTLTIAFDASKYGQIEKNAAEFDAKELEKGLRLPLFQWYTSLALAIEEVPQKFASMTRSCPCHKSMPQEWGEAQRCRIFKQQFHTTDRCPLQGCNAGLLAGTEVEVVVQELSDVSIASVLKNAPLNSPPEARATILKDFGTAKQVLLAVLKEKLDFWHRLPWMLCGLTHPDPCVRKNVAGRAVMMIEAESRPELHHPVTRKWLQGDAFEDLRGIASGRPWALLKDTTKGHIAELLLLGTNETAIEGKHAQVTHTKHRYSNLGPVMVSLSNPFTFARTPSSIPRPRREHWNWQ